MTNYNGSKTDFVLDNWVGTYVLTDSLYFFCITDDDSEDVELPAGTVVKYFCSSNPYGCGSHNFISQTDGKEYGCPNLPDYEEEFREKTKRI